MLVDQIMSGVCWGLCWVCAEPACPRQSSARVCWAGQGCTCCACNLHAGDGMRVACQRSWCCPQVHVSISLPHSYICRTVAAHACNNGSSRLAQHCTCCAVPPCDRSPNAFSTSACIRAPSVLAAVARLPSHTDACADTIPSPCPAPPVLHPPHPTRRPATC